MIYFTITCDDVVTPSHMKYGAAIREAEWILTFVRMRSKRKVAS